MVHLSRSTVPAQRAQSLIALAGVLRNAARPSPAPLLAPSSGDAAKAVATAAAPSAEEGATLQVGRAVVRWCKDSDAALLLRVSMDDKYLSCVHAALDAADAMAEAMSGAPLEAILYETSRPSSEGWRGCEGAAFAPPPPPHAQSSVMGGGGGAADDGGGGESDAEAIRRELFAGWARTGLHGRLRYLLDSPDLSPAGRHHALALLCRSAYRSVALAADVGTCHVLELPGSLTISKATRSSGKSVTSNSVSMTVQKRRSSSSSCGKCQVTSDE